MTLVGMRVENNPLSQSEVDTLPDGSKVSIVWSGGNGPHTYTVRKSKNRAWAKECNSPIVFVGDAAPYTVVRLVIEDED